MMTQFNYMENAELIRTAESAYTGHVSLEAAKELLEELTDRLSQAEDANKQLERELEQAFDWSGEVEAYKVEFSVWIQEAEFHNDTMEDWETWIQRRPTPPAEMQINGIDP